MAIKRGFSIIELTVVIGLMSLLTLAISTIMLTSVVSSNRVRTTTKVKQAGNYVIDQLQGLLRNAKGIPLCDSSSASITLTNPDGGTTVIASESDGTSTRIASNSGIYLTPSDTQTSSFNLVCEPTDSYPSLVKFSFDLQSTLTTKATENPLLHFETSVNLRNE